MAPHFQRPPTRPFPAPLRLWDKEAVSGGGWLPSLGKGVALNSRIPQVNGRPGPEEEVGKGLRLKEHGEGALWESGG